MKHLSSSLFLLSWLLILSLVEQTFCLHLNNRECPQSSCGNLEIKHPFYLKSQKSRCTTHSQYQLNCEGNRATLQIFEPEKYIVTKIDSYGINVVSARFAEGSCTVPTGSLSFSSVLKETNYLLSNLGSLVKCRELISNNSMYLPVGCMSTNDSFVYLVDGAYQVRYLEPSCFYLALLPLGFEVSGNTTGDAFKLLQEEFTLYFGDGDTNR
ncbi:Receptor kinase [Rhynchospora pubera]|uniref:RING-type E3 ubiquitin transferase n=1 Tax=Rhynchospora pubera TaxID=906938 RepID=A0AAV8EKC6_9POAL|nr:Receptor kinase [Rhynchospora pubera]